MRHVILGPGGIGGLIGACLAHFGDTVTMVGRPEAMANYPAELQLESPFGNLRVPVAHATTVPPADVVWITVKATQLEQALNSFPTADGVRGIVPLLNGVDHIARLREQYGAERVIPATIAVESERVAPGHIVHRSPFANLNVASSGRELLGEAVANFTKRGFTCRFIDNEATLLWSKLVFLAPLALVSTVTGQETGEFLSDPASREKVFSCVREACAVAKKEGATVDADAVIANMSKLPPHMRSSMQKDVEQGKAPELDPIAGPILRSAEKHGIEVPVTRELVEQVKKKMRR
jgi:2-dehydropantoate 2-reductase